MLEMIQSPQLAAEVTLQPINAFDLDAAIIFADILPPLIGMGLSLEFHPGKGPVIHNPIQVTYDIDLLGTPPAIETLAPTLEAIKLVKSELEPKGIPLIGFPGAPFTLASYAIEGGGSKDYAKTKALMYCQPAAWKRLMEKLVTVQAVFDWWLRRRKECGRPCQTCATLCEVRAIRPTGEINANECHYCLDCQITYYSDRRCLPLIERRQKRENRAARAQAQIVRFKEPVPPKA